MVQLIFVGPTWNIGLKGVTNLNIPFNYSDLFDLKEKNLIWIKYFSIMDQPNSNLRKEILFDLKQIFPFFLQS